MSNNKTNQPNLNDMLLPEILRKISSQVTPTRKKELMIKLRDSVHHNSLMTMFILIYDWSIEFKVPDGIPSDLKLNRVPSGTNHTYLRTEYTKLQHLVVSPNNQLPQAKVEQLYVQLLENLHHTESHLLLRVINKSVFTGWFDEKKYNIPFKLVQEAYPEVVWFVRGNGVEPAKYNPFDHLKSTGETEQTETTGESGKYKTSIEGEFV
jgi:hypothetical protein